MKRYIPGITSDSTFGMVPHEHGGYVEYGDHAAIRHKMEEAVKLLKECGEFISNVQPSDPCGWEVLEELKSDIKNATEGSESK